MILVINAGSSSIKFSLFKANSKTDFQLICNGLAERIFIDGLITIKYNGEKITKKTDLPNHEITSKKIIELLKEEGIIKNFDDIKAMAHRVVQGGEISDSSIVTDEMEKIFEDCSTLAPLHNPANLTALRSFKKVIKAPNVAVFDTSFHTTIPLENQLYSVPYEWYTDYNVKKYGAHGTSFRFITEKLAQVLNKPKDKLNAIICHLGNGASICAVKNGKSINTTMGFTPLAGIAMGTRSGDIDPSILEYMAIQLKKDIREITSILNRESGVKGMSGISSDMREVQAAYENKNERAINAMKVYIRKIVNYIVAFQNDLENDIDAIVFTGGIGENSSEVRKMVIDKIKTMNISLDDIKNKKGYDEYAILNDSKSDIKVYAIRTDEELMMARDAYALINKK